ncbi:anti-sigma factor antagonist [Blastopirellula marina]|uniref:Anti-sigma factor antagonist n=1 Tax=Blastopirellula marina TaxID=124 RepID=A0A2S8F239_9BACT|nr:MULTISPECIES: STAS domain-containing protein [Pirellulaceae]PQO25974.1 anti-sigma factor antagonist [Blastopirellula marina]RCS44332.1 anti-sigma factor antagonist [Bremerella cremea]
MKLSTEIFGAVMVVHTPEELGEDQADNVRAFLESRERNKLIVDLDGTETIDSVGLEILLDVQDTLREKGGDLRIATTNYANRKILEVTRLDSMLEVFDSVIDAVKSFA